MQGKIALEEHFAIPDTLMDSAGFVPDSYWPELKGRLLDIQERRLAEMDRHGIEMMILSLNAPAVQAITPPSSLQMPTDGAVLHKAADSGINIVRMPPRPPSGGQPPATRTPHELHFSAGQRPGPVGSEQ